MKRSTLVPLALVLGALALGVGLWAWLEARAESERVARAEARAAERAERRERALAELREASAPEIPDVIHGVTLAMTLEEVRAARPDANVHASTAHHDEGLHFFEEDLPNGARVMYGFDDETDRLAQIQILSLVPTVNAITPHLAAMHERYGPPTGVWDCEPEGALPTRRFSWRRERVAIADVLLVYGDRVSITLYVTTPERMGASIYRSSCHPTPTDQIERFPTASPEQVQAVQAEGE
jgi:hypothetical protein